MRPRACLLATVLLLAPLAFACGKKEERPSVTTPPASPTAGAVAREAPGWAVAADDGPDTAARGRDGGAGRFHRCAAARHGGAQGARDDAGDATATTAPAPAG